jgi:hypothetical protein
MNGIDALVLSMSVTLVVALACVLAVVALARAQAPLRRARQQAVAALCAQRGLVAGAAPGDFAMVGPVFPRWLTNSFSSPDHAVAVADFMRPAGKNTQFFTLLAFTVAGVNVPYVAVTRRLLAAVILGGPPSVELESIDFDQRFSVKATDRRSAVMLLDSGMMQLLLDCELVNFIMTGDKVLAYINRAAERRHQPAEPVEFEQLFKFWNGFVARMPPILRSEYAASGA